MTTLLQLKMEKAELRNAMDVAIVNDEEADVLKELSDEYITVVGRLRNAERKLLVNNENEK